MDITTITTTTPRISSMSIGMAGVFVR